MGYKLVIPPDYISRKRSIFLVAIDKIVKIPLGYLILVLTANIYSVKDISEYAFASSLFFLLQPLSDFGINQYLAKPKYSSNDEYLGIVTNSIALKLFFSLLFFLLSIIISLFFDSFLIKIVLISLSASNFLQSFSQAVRQYFLDNKLYRTISVSDSLYTWPNLAMKLITLLSQYSIVFLAPIQLVSSLLQVIPLVLKFSKKAPRLAGHVLLKYSSRVLILSRTYFLSSLVVMVYVKSDQLLITWIRVLMLSDLMLLLCKLLKLQWC